MKKKQGLSDAELLSFALKDVRPLPGRVIKNEIKQKADVMKQAVEKIVYRDVSNKVPKKEHPLPPLLFFCRIMRSSRYSFVCLGLYLFLFHLFCLFGAKLDALPSLLFVWG